MDKWKKFISGFEKISGKINYTYAHIYLLIYYLNEKELVGRYYLKHKLGLGEATIRNILMKMKKLGIIESLRGGHKLTSKGLETAKDILNKIEIINLDIPIKPGKHNILIIIRNIGNKIKTGVEERDNVIKYGGTGAVILIFRDGKIVFPDSGLEVDNWYPRLTEKVTSKIQLKEEDVILISGGEDSQSSLISGLNAAIRLLYK